MEDISIGSLDSATCLPDQTLVKMQSPSEKPYLSNAFPRLHSKPLVSNISPILTSSLYKLRIIVCFVLQNLHTPF
jgi:hypothetical protein